MSEEKHTIRAVLGEHYAKLFWSKVEKTETCWIWMGARRKDYPYGKCSFGASGKTWHFSPHKLVYEMFVGRVPEGMELDHLCRVPYCCNWAHLEPVTHKENMRRGDSPVAIHARQTHCKHGHSLEDAYRQHGARICKPCRKNQADRRRLAIREYARLYARKRRQQRKEFAHA